MPLDPRLRRLVDTVNGQIADRAIRHSVYLQQFASHEVNEIVSFLDKDMIPKLLGNIDRRLQNIATRGLGASVRSTERLKYLTRSSYDILQTGLRGSKEKLAVDLEDLARHEVDFTRAMLQKPLPFDLNLVSPPIETLRSIVRARPMQGEYLSQWFGNLSKGTHTAIIRELNIGIASGSSVPNMVQSLRGTRAMNYSDGIMGGLRRHVETLVRTSVNHVSAQTRLETFSQNKDIVRRWRFVALLDKNTTLICMGFDGKEFDHKEGPYPPQHLNCRSAAMPVLSSVVEAGLDKYGIKDPAPAQKLAKTYTAGEMKKKRPRGKYTTVSAKMTYGDWLKTQPKAVQNEILGPARAELFRTGKVKIDQFTKNGRTLTLEQLGKLELQSA